MAHSKVGATIWPPNDVQDIPVSRVPREAARSVQMQSDDRVFNSAAFVAHYTHLAAGYRRGTKTCGLCSVGPEAVLAGIETAPGYVKPVLSDGGGVDKEGDAASSSSDGLSRVEWND